MENKKANLKLKQFAPSPPPPKNPLTKFLIVSNLILLFSILIGIITFSGGWHIPEEILSGTFRGKYNFSSNVTFQNNLNYDLEKFGPFTSCKDILEKSFEFSKIRLNSGIYKINPDGNNEFQVYCDMETDGGGWIIYLIRNHQTSWDTGWNPNPSLNINSYEDLENKCGDLGLKVFADYQSSSSIYWEVALEYLKKQTDYFTNNNNDGGGIALGLKWNGTNWVNMENGETSIKENIDGDRCTGDLQLCGFWDFRDNYGEGPEDWLFSQTQGILCGGKCFLKNKTYK